MIQQHDDARLFGFNSTAGVVSASTYAAYVSGNPVSITTSKTSTSATQTSTTKTTTSSIATVSATPYE